MLQMRRNCTILYMCPIGQNSDTHTAGDYFLLRPATGDEQENTNENERTRKKVGNLLNVFFLGKRFGNGKRLAVPERTEIETNSINSRPDSDYISLRESLAVEEIYLFESLKLNNEIKSSAPFVGICTLYLHKHTSYSFQPQFIYCNNGCDHDGNQ